MNVLFLVMEFPPVNTTGNFRTLKFIKYLHEFGANPIVVTLKETEASRILNAAIDNELLKEIPEGTPIYRIKCNPVDISSGSRVKKFLKIYFSIVDSIGSAWEPHVFNHIAEIIQKHRPEVIYTSLPPFSSGMLARKISKKFQLPYVVDMRDLWSHWGSDPHGSYLHYLAKKKLEHKVFKHAARVIAVTPQLIDIFRKTHPSIDGSKYVLIPNGFDYNLEQKEVVNKNRGKFVIGYVGSFYYQPISNELALKPWWKKKGHRMLQYSPAKEDWLYRSPYFFLKALQKLLEDHPQYRDRIRFDFIGKEPSWLVNMIEEFGLADIYHSHGFLLHREVLRLQENFDAFLATSEKVIGGEHYCLPSKLFDYLQFNKPIVAFVTPGIQKEMLMNSGLGVFCDPDNMEKSASTLKDLIEGKINSLLNIEYLNQYKRKHLAEKLSDVFKQVQKSHV